MKLSQLPGPLGGLSAGGRRGLFKRFVLGVGGNATAGVATKGDTDTISAAALAGELNRQFRIPTFPDKRCANGDILLWVEGSSSNAADYYTHTIFQYRSSDNGDNWSGPTVVYRDPDFSGGVDWINLGGGVIDAATGKIVLVFTKSENGGGDGTPVAVGDIKIMKVTSTDNGLIYSAATNISATAKKQSGQAAPFDDTNGAWGWCIITGGCQDENGRMIFCGDHRYTIDVIGTSWSHVLITDDAGDTWALAGPQESTAANDFSNEAMVVRGLTPGELYMQCRITNQAYRGYFLSHDNGDTWDTMVACDGVGGRPNLPGSNCDWGLTRAPNGKIYCCGPADTVIRAHLAVYELSGGGITVSASRKISTLPGGYSTIMALDNSSLLMVAESTPTNIASVTAASTPWYLYLQQWQVPVSYLSAAVSQPLYTRLPFNDGPVGAADILGSPIKDHGTQGCAARATVYGEFTATGGKCLGTGVAFWLAELQENATGGDKGALGHGWDPLLDSCTWELPGFKMAASASVRNIFDSRGPLNGAGITWAIAGTDRSQFTVSDGTNTATVLSAASPTLDDGVARDLAVTWDKSDSKVRVYINGALSATGTANTSVGSIKSLMAGLAMGAKTDGSAPGIFEFDEIIFTRGIAKTSGFATAADVKPTLTDLYGSGVPVDPFDDAALVAHVWATHDGGRSAGRDLYGGWDKHALPVALGRGVQSFRCPKSGRLFRAAGVNRGAWPDVDAALGPHWRASYESSASGWMGHRTAITAHDFPQNTGDWSFFCGVKFVSTAAGGYQAILDNCKASTGAAGVTILRLSATQLYVVVSDGLGGAPTGITCALTFAVSMAIGTPLFLGVSASRTGGVKAYRGVMNGTSPPTLSVTAAQNYATNTAGTFPSSGYLAFGAYHDDAGTHSDARWRDACLRSDTMTDQEMQDACNAMAAIAEF